MDPRSFARAVTVLAFTCGGTCFGCAVAADPPDGENTSVSAEAVAGGCRWICPKCRPGAICSKMACYEDCNAATKCGDARCNKDQVCCNESCGICTGPGEGCIDLYCMPAEKACMMLGLCIEGFHWSATKCACLPDTHGKKPGTCTTDADCRLEADYCTGCDCRALSSSQTLPACPGPGVRCFADPCMTYTAACVSGTCSVR